MSALSSALVPFSPHLTHDVFNEGEKKNGPINSLPNALIMYIFSFLNTYNLSQCCKVCRTWSPCSITCSKRRITRSLLAFAKTQGGIDPALSF